MGNTGRLGRFFGTFTSESTVRSYRSTLRRYFDVFGFKTYPQEELAKAVEQYFDEDGRNYQHDIQDFFAAIKGDEAPSTIRTRLSVVRTFLGENGVEVPDILWKSLGRRIKGTRARTVDYVPKRDELRRIIAHMPIQGQALFLMQLSSGMRIGEVLSLEVEDVQMSSDPAKTATTVQLRGTGTKSGNPRLVYISSEATEALDEWYKIRPNYLRNSKRTRATKKTDARVFPFMRRTAYVIFNGAVGKTGLLHKQKETNRYTLHPHCLRKWFRTRMATLIPVDVVEAMMGHEGYLTQAYRRYTPEELAVFYKEGEPALLLHQPINLGEVKEAVDGQISEVVNGLTAENMNLRERVQELEGTVREIQVFYKGVQELRKEEEAEAKALKDALEAKLKEVK